MSNHAFFICRGRVVDLANPSGAGLQYQAHPRTLAPGATAEPVRHVGAETVVVVRQGTLDVMVNGAASMLGAGSFVRIPAGVWFAYRNVGTAAARVLVRTAPAPAARGSLSIMFSPTAA